MNRYSSFFAVGTLVFGLSLTGCGQQEKQPDLSYSVEERLEALANLDPSDIRRADTFASGLCVITKDVSLPDSNLSAEAAGVFSLNDHSVILAKNAYETLYPASTTKIMTALLAIRHGDLQEKVTVGQEVIITESGATLCNIHPGDTLTLEQLLYGLMMPSGNDAGAAIAVHIAGSIEDFADMMNREAWAIGATNTHFVNPHGLQSEDHYTTAYDLYLIFQEAMKEPAFRKIIGTGTYTANYTDASNQPKTQTWNNSNRFITGKQPMPDGLTMLGGKTGTTMAAGSCLVVGSQDEEGHEYVSVVLKAAGRTEVYEDMTNIIQKIVN